MPLLLTGGKGADLLIRGDVVLNIRHYNVISPTSFVRYITYITHPKMMSTLQCSGGAHSTPNITRRNDNAHALSHPGAVGALDPGSDPEY
jgi:hypothetical protein